jgi:hypothetical protein
MSEPLAYVVMDGPDTAFAICKVEHGWDETLEEFFVEHSGKDIRLVPLKEGLALMRAPRGRFGTLWRKLLRRLDRTRPAR